jgi:hypothetical protein
MNDREGRWWNAALLAALGLLALALVAGEDAGAEGLAGLLGVVAIGVALLAVVLVVAALWPGFSRRAQENLETTPGKAFLVGLVNYLFLGAVALVTLNLGPLAVIGLGLLGLLLLGTFLGLPAVAGLLGVRLNALRERETTRAAEVAAGSITLYVAALLPAVGWFLVLPALLFWSLGAAVLALMGGRRAAPAGVAGGLPE